MSENLLAYDNVEIAYDGQSVVRDVSFSVRPGQVLGIVGESGSGKSTLVKAAMGLLGPAGRVVEGDIRFEGRSILGLSERQLRALCGSRLSMVFQDSLASFTPIRTVGDQVHEFMAAHAPVTRRESDDLAARLFGDLGLPDPQRVLESYPFELSGGMGQRVGMAVALLGDPKVVFADEPTSALDVVAQAQAVQLLDRACKRSGAAIVLVTHNMGVARAVADDILVLKEGLVMEQGPAQQVLNAPQSGYTRRLLEAARGL